MSNDTQTTIPIRNLWVNYAWLGMDEGWPCAEKPGTLIHTMSHGIVVKLDADTCRPATDCEARAWTRPVSPSWADHYRSKPDAR